MSGPDTVPQLPDSRSLTHPTSVYVAAQQLLPARTWQENPLLWIGVVVAVLMAVPFLANWAMRDANVTLPKPGAPAASAAIAAPATADAAPERAAPAITAAPAPAAAEAPQPLRAPEASRQMVTKCVENGRVVYTQTGACAGSVTAVPIDPGKNVVGPGSASR